MTLVPTETSPHTQQEVMYKNEIPSNTQSECDTRNEPSRNEETQPKIRASMEFKATGTAFGSKSGNSNSGSGKPNA